jgi:transposase
MATAQQKFAEPKFITLEQAAKRAGVSLETARAWCVRWENGHDDGLPSHHMGELPPDEAKRKLRQIDPAELEEFIRRRRLGNKAAERDREQQAVRHRFRQASRTAQGKPRREYVRQ